MTLDDMIRGAIVLFFTYCMFFAARRFYNIMHWRVDIRHELVKEDNVALGTTVVGYYFGLLIALGGILSIARQSWDDTVIDVLFFGLFATLILNISTWINDKLILYKINNEEKIIQDHDMAVGVVEAGNHIAMGLILYGAFSGVDRNLIIAGSFCLLGQLFLILVAHLYHYITPFNLQDELAAQNTGVGLAFGGFLIAIGNMIRIGLAGEYYSLMDNLMNFGKFCAFAMVFFPLIRLFSNTLLLPKINMNEVLVARTRSHTSAGAIEAFSYIAASFLIAWVLA